MYCYLNIVPNGPFESDQIAANRNIRVAICRKRIEKLGMPVKCTNHARLICSIYHYYTIRNNAARYDISKSQIHGITAQDNAKGTECII